LGIKAGQQPARMSIWRENPHHRQRVNALACGASLPMGKQLCAFVVGNEWMIHVCSAKA